MTEKYITYKMDGKTFEVPESMSSKVEEKYPSATIEMRMGEKRFDVPISRKQDAINKYGSDLSYTFDKAPAGEEQSAVEEATYARNEKDNDERTTWGESIAKGLGAGVLRTTKGAIDAFTILQGGHAVRDHNDMILYRMPEYDTMVKEGNNPAIELSKDIGGISERWSKESDPTGGEQGYIDLIKKGKIGTALQKAVASAGESLPASLAARSPWTMTLYAIGTAASNYADSVIENPDIPKWKRAANAIGSAALETAVEKFADPIFKYIGGKNGAGEITEEAAKEIIEKETKEATDGIAKRIFNVLKNIGKDMGGEGVEEVITSAGDDALGQALDIISGDNDYGYVAQWEQMKEQNPDADLGDFAMSKAKEYMDDFIGGALSTPYMSGTAQGVQHIQKRAERNAMEKAYNEGSSMDYNNMYDTDDVVREDLDKVIGAFTNETGEQSISNEFIEMLSSEDAYHLSQNEDLSVEQRSALGQLAIDKARQEGLTKTLDDRLNNNINASRILVEEAAEDDGSIIVGIFGDRPVYIKGGVVNNGSVTLYNGQRGPVIAYDVRTGEQMTVRSDQVTDAVVDNAENFANTIEEGIRMREQARRDEARNTMSPLAKFKAVQPFAGKKMMVDLGNGTTEVDVLRVLPQSQQVVIKGKKADLGGQSITKIGADVFYDSISRDDDGNPMFVEGIPETEATEQNSTEEVDYRGENVSILINGVPTNVEVVSQDTPSDTIVYEYTDENGNSRRGSSTIGAFQSAIQGAQDFAPEIMPETVPETPVAETPAEDTPEITEEPAPQEEPEQIQLNPEDIDWDALFNQDPEGYFAEIQNQYGEEAIDVLNEEIEAAQSELDSLGKAKTKSQSERAKNRKRKAELKSRIESLDGMITRLTSTEITEAEPTATNQPVDAPVDDVPVAEAPTSVETPTTEVVAEPTPVQETPVAETPTEPQPAIPVAPTPVDNPVEEAKTREEALDIQLKRAGIPRAQKQDMAFNAGKAVGDMFATREEYEDYLAIATNLGEYNDDFERGVKEPFAKRETKDNKQYHIGTDTESKSNSAELGEMITGWMREGGVEIRSIENEQEAEESDTTQYAKKGTSKALPASRKKSAPTLGDGNSSANVDISSKRKKVIKNLNELLVEINKQPKDHLTFLKRIKLALGASMEIANNPDKTLYVENNIDNSTHTHRVANHASNALTFAERDRFDNNSAVVIKMSDKRFRGSGKVNLIDYVYYPDLLSGEKQIGIIHGIIDWVNTGEYSDTNYDNKHESTIRENQLETSSGVVYGYVEDGIVHLDYSLMNPNTPIHEYTHLWDNALMQLNPALWEKGKALMKKTSLWKEVINDPNYADIKDNEDLVASEVHSRLVGTKGAEKLNQLEQEARAKGLTKGAKELSILGRLREWLNEATQWLKDAFTGTWSKEEIDNVTLADFLNMPLRDLANFKALPKVETGVVTNENGDVIADNNGNGHIQFSIKTWREGGRDYLAEYLEQDNTLAEDEKANILERMDEFYENAQKYTDVYVPFGTWSEASVKYDKDGNPLMSVIKANGDYAMNLDFSLVCKKRRPLNLLLRELINRNAFGTYTLRERELAEINWILQEHGFEVACALCFVDSKRYRVTGVADVFATLYNRFVRALAPDGAQISHFNYSNNPNVEAVENGIDTLPDEQLNWKKFDELAKKYGPKTVEGKVARFLRENPSQRRLVDATDFIDAKGFEAVKEGNPALLSLYNSKKGTGGPKASFGDVQYLNDILKRDKAFDVEKAYSVGGVRLQSFSDFVPHMYFDYMQLFAELAAKNLPAHAYTKEVLFAKIFGMTGLKINMSLVPSVVEGGIAPGLDSEGNYTWADAIKDKDGNVIQQAQSFPFDEAMAIQNAEGYSKNCGVIAVGISDEHIEKMLDDPNIPYIIPYHKSSLNAIVARMTNIDQYKDYTKVQNTRKANGSKLPKGTPDFNFNAYLHENPNATPQDAAQAYLDWCKENKYKPKFSQFAYHPNYYKLLQDFNTMDTTTGEYAPQGPVTMTFPTEQNAFGNVETLIQQGLKEDAELEEKFETDIKAVADEVEQRLEEIKAEPQLTGKKYEQHLDKVVGDRMTKIKKMSETTAEDYGDGILSRSGDITPEMDAEYLAAVERGDMETAQRMVNEAADKHLNETLLPNDEDEVGFKYHRGPAPAKTFKRYAVLNVTPEGFKAAYAGNKTGTPVGVWLDAQNLASYTSDMVQFDDGTFATYIAGDTGAATNTKFSPERAEELGVKGGQRWLLERGGKHSSDVPNFSQMNLKVNENGEKVSSAKDGALPHNKLIFEIEYGISEEGDLTDYVRENGRMMKGKNQGLAKIGPNQYYDFKTNPNAVGNWGIGGTFRITRLVPHSEVVSVTEQYKKDAIAEANRLYEKGEISKKDRDARVKSAESIQVQKWVGGYNPADFGLSEEIVKQMAEEGSKMKLTDPVTYDDAGNVIPLSERFNSEKRDIRYRKSDIQNAAADYLAGPQRAELIQRAVNEEATKLGVTVTYKTREEMPNGHKNDKGYYNTKTGEIVVCTENNADINDAIKTIIHETVAHKGLRNLMGDRFNEFINRVYDALDAETKAKVDALADKSYNGNKTVAMEEYMASLAETEDFAKTSVWEKIKDIFNSIINSILGRNDIKIGDNELRYILRASYANMVNPRNMETIDGWAKDTNMRNELGINEATPEIMSRTGIDPTEVARESARTVYDRVVNEQWQEFQRQFQDAMQPVRIAIDAIQQETGNIPIEDYENYILIQNQASSRSRVEIDEFASKYYSPIIEQVNHMIDMIMEKRGWDVKDKKRRAEVYAEVRQYLIAKHGLERNKYYQETKKRPLNKAEREEKKQEAYDMYQYELSKISSSLSKSEKEAAEEAAKVLYESELAKIKTMTTADLRDYSGLTALFGYDPAEWEDAEVEAQRFVDEFERGLGRVDHRNDNGDIVGFEQSKEIAKLWDRINKATDKTLRHSYESGLISRSQYEYIKSMFGCYIPLRGFDETTAEDVYAYARFEGNRFNPAVYKAEGRTSVADDPLAIIMNMAESEITQGNKNRAKQALYNFLLNRPVTGMDGSEIQNSLMQVEDVWYIRTIDENGNEVYTIAAPDHESGETYEEFEERMRAIEGLETSEETEEGEEYGPRPATAFKSKKGQVDVGMRFQKQMNRNAHYVYLKVNGVDKAIYINGDPKASEAINGSYRPKQMFGESKFREINRIISSMFTNYSLPFTIRNFARDMFYSHINISIKESDPAYRKAFRRNWGQNLFRVGKMLYDYRNGKFEGADLNEYQAAFVDFMQNGGQTGYTVINSVENHKKDLERAIKNIQKGIKKGGVKDSTVFKLFLGWIEFINETAELVTRFSAYKTSRDMGRGVVSAINDAKEITVNFNTKGAQDGRGWMGFVSQYFGWSKFFFNASIQGVQNLGAMAQANKLKFCTTVGGIMATGFLMPVITSLVHALMGGDDEEEYWNIPEYDRQNNLCVVAGDDYVKVPLPIGFREMYAIGDMVAAMAFDKKFKRDVLQTGKDMANKVASVVLPINPLESSANGLDLWQTGLYFVLPSSTQFAVQNATNIDWKGTPLQKEYTYNENDPQWMKAFESNPDWMTGLSKWCNEHIHPDGSYSGWDWSPEKLDNTLSNVFGGIYNVIKQTGRYISKAASGDWSMSNLPIASVAYGSGLDDDNMFITDAYFDMKDYYDKNVNYIKRRAKKFGYDLDDVFLKHKGQHHPKMQEIYSDRNYDFMEEWYKGDDELKKLNDKIKKLEKEIAGTENPTTQKIEKLAKLKSEYDIERREFVEDMLELN